MLGSIVLGMTVLGSSVVGMAVPGCSVVRNGCPRKYYVVC
jgi:hypothetical protein